jgi:hypothetical protein
MKKEFTLNLSYFKQGDDLFRAMNSTKEDAEAFLAHASALEASVACLRKMASLAKEGLASIDYADVHFIGVICEEEAVEELMNSGWLSLEESYDEDIECCTGDCDNCKEN